MKKQKNIDFIVIGAQKSGTTWLFRNLKQIREFELPPYKEFHYFDRNPDYPSPNSLSETLLVDRLKQKKYFLRAIKKVLYSVKFKNLKLSRFYLKWFFSNYSDKWYLSLFKDFDGFTGDITPSYSILKQDDIARMYKLNPNVKLLLILRNPIDRAWSHYRHTKKKMRSFHIENLSNEDIIKFMEGEGQTLRSDYMKILDNYLNIFPKEQIIVGFYDAIIDNPTVLLNDILKHICGDTAISIEHLNLKKVFNESPVSDCPKEIKAYLKDRYYTQIKDLSEKHGSYFTKWYEDLYMEESTTIGKETELLPTIYMKS